MKSFADWKTHEKRRKLYEDVGDMDEIKAVFDDLRETVKRVSESAGFFGTVKRGFLGGLRGLGKAVFGKDSKAAAAVPDVSSNYDLNRTSALGTLGRSLVGGAKDIGNRVGQELERKREIERARRERDILRREDATADEGQLFVEWDKNALEVIMAKIDEAEQRIMDHVKQAAELKPDSGVSKSGPNSWDVSGPGGRDSSFVSQSSGNIPPSELYHQMQVQLPAASIERVERGYEKDPLMQKILQVAGRSHMKTVFPKVAQELGLDASEVLKSVKQKYGDDVAEILMGKSLNKSSRERLDSLGGEVERKIHVPLMHQSTVSGPGGDSKFI